MANYKPQAQRVLDYVRKHGIRDTSSDTAKKVSQGIYQEQKVYISARKVSKTLGELREAGHLDGGEREE